MPRKSRPRPTGQQFPRPALGLGPRLAGQALRAGFQSLPSATVAHLFRHVPPVNSTPNAEPSEAPAYEGSAVSGSRLAMANGASFAGYTILRPLGAGGMAEVYLALHPRLPRRDVIKVLAEAVTADSEFRERFNREADLAATLWHPHVVGVHDRGEFDGQLWISMDYVEGTDAGELLTERYPKGMPPDEVVRIVTALHAMITFRARGIGTDLVPSGPVILAPRIDFMAAQATRHNAPLAVKHGARARLTACGATPISAAAYWHSANKTANAL